MSAVLLGGSRRFPVGGGGKGRLIHSHCRWNEKGGTCASRGAKTPCAKGAGISPSGKKASPDTRKTGCPQEKREGAAMSFILIQLDSRGILIEKKKTFAVEAEEEGLLGKGISVTVGEKAHPISSFGFSSSGRIFPLWMGKRKNASIFSSQGGWICAEPLPH